MMDAAHQPLDEDPPLPFSTATPQELAANPGLARLLQGLGGTLGTLGVRPPLARELSEAEAELSRRRGAWLRWGALWGALQELLGSPHPPDGIDRPTIQALETALTQAQLRRSPFGPLLPPPEDPAPLRARLLPALERRLGQKWQDLVNYYSGETPEDAPNRPKSTETTPKCAPNSENGAQMSQNPPNLTQNDREKTQNPSNLTQNSSKKTQNPSNLTQNDSKKTQNPPIPPQTGSEMTPNPPIPPQTGSEMTQNPPIPPQTASADVITAALAREREELERERRRHSALLRLLEGQRRDYAQVLGRCGAALGALRGVAGRRRELDQRQSRYLEAKGRALLLKIRLEELTLLLATYPPETVEAHRRIRAGLQDAGRQAEAEAAALRERLEELEGLGRPLAELAEEYGRLRERLENQRWALQQLRPSPEPPSPPPPE